MKVSANMAVVGQRRWRGRVWLILVLLAFFAGYSWFLTHQESQAKAYLTNLRKTNPDLYLSQVVTVIGFRRFLDEYRVLKHYDGYQTHVPSFLFGRWGLFPEAKRVGDSYLADQCLNSISFEDGFVRLAGKLNEMHPVRYSLAGESVNLQRLDGGDFASIHLVSYGVRLHHIEIQLPGDKGISYGYLCK